MHASCRDRPLEKVRINEVELDMLIDSGATDDVIHEEDFRKIASLEVADLSPNGSILAYGQDQSMDVLGKFKAKMETQNGNSCLTEIMVVRSNKPTIGLISFATSRKLGLFDDDRFRRAIEIRKVEIS